MGGREGRVVRLDTSLFLSFRRPSPPPCSSFWFLHHIHCMASNDNKWFICISIYIDGVAFKKNSKTIVVVIKKWSSLQQRITIIIFVSSPEKLQKQNNLVFTNKRVIILFCSLRASNSGYSKVISLKNVSLICLCKLQWKAKWISFSTSFIDEQRPGENRPSSSKGHEADGCVYQLTAGVRQSTGFTSPQKTQMIRIIYN